MPAVSGVGVQPIIILLHTEALLSPLIKPSSFRFKALCVAAKFYSRNIHDCEALKRHFINVELFMSPQAKLYLQISNTVIYFKIRSQTPRCFQLFWLIRHVLRLQLGGVALTLPPGYRTLCTNTRDKGGSCPAPTGATKLTSEQGRCQSK